MTMMMESFTRLDSHWQDHPNNLPLAPVVLLTENNGNSFEEVELSGSRPEDDCEESYSNKKKLVFHLFDPIHPQCIHISYGCMILSFFAFVVMTALLKKYWPVMFPTSTDCDDGQPSLSCNISLSPSLSPTEKSPVQPSPYGSSSTSSTESSTTKYYGEKKLFASYGKEFDWFGASCSISEELIVIGADGADGNLNEGAAYLFHLNGNELKKLTAGSDGEEQTGFGLSVSIDEKIVVGANKGNYVQIFARNGQHERTIKCEDSMKFGRAVATLGDKVAVIGYLLPSWKLFVYSTEGKVLKVLDLDFGGLEIPKVAISENFIVSTTLSKTHIFLNSGHDFTKIVEIPQGGWEVTTSGDKLVIGHPWAMNHEGAAWLYQTDGTLVKKLEIPNSTDGSSFGFSVDMTEEKVLIGAPEHSHVYIYSAITGNFEEKVQGLDARNGDNFGVSVCSNGLYYVVGSTGADNGDEITSGAAYLFQFSQ